MKILFITDNFPPEVNAPAIRTFEHCNVFAEKGAEVNIITCAPNFPDGKVYEGYTNAFYKKEIVGKLIVHRVITYISRNIGFVKRLLDFNSFAFTAFMAGLFIKSDIIISTSPQFFTCFTGFALSRIKRKPWVLEIRDLWPESVYILDKNSFIYKLFSAFEHFFYRKADHIIVVTESFKDTISGYVKNPGKIDVIFNGANFSTPPPDPMEIKNIEKLYNLKNKFVLGYIGTFGIAHSLDFYVSLASKIKSVGENIVFVLIGTGAEYEKVVAAKEKTGLENIIIRPKIPREQVPAWLSKVDLMLVPLKDNPVYHKVIPSKIFENAALKVPVMLGVEGEVKKIVEKYGLGLAFKPDNEQSFLDTLQKFYNGEVNLGSDYEAFYENFDRRVLASRMYKILEDIHYSRQ